MATRRPIGLLILGLGFLALAVAAFVYARRVMANPGQFLPPGAKPPVVTGLAFASGIAAAWATLAAWSRSESLRFAIVFWSLTIAGLLVTFQTALGTEGEPLWLVLFPYVGLGILTWALVRLAARRA